MPAITSSAKSWRPRSDSARASISSRWYAHLVGEIGGAGRPQRGLRLVRLAVHQIDHRKPRGDLRARGALQPVVDLVLQQLGRLVEQIDRNQPVGEPPDHLVAAPADRGQVAEIVEQAERIDRRQRIGLAGEEQRCRRSWPPRRGCCASSSEFGMRGERDAHDVEGVAVAALLGVEPREQLQRLDLGLVAAPGGGERLQLVDRLGLASISPSE